MMMMMMKEERGARVCETCRAAACAVYCRADSAYLCSACDARVHGANRVASWHERVRVCEACERAPAAFLCKADAASLCSSCDADIHSANPLARRHLRIPILPIHTASPFDDNDDDDDDEDDQEAEAASWLILNQGAASAKPGGGNNNPASMGDVGFGFGGGSGEGVVDEYLDLMEFNNNNNGNSGGGDDQKMMSLMMNSGGYGGGGDSVVPCGHHHHHGKGNNGVNMMLMMEENSKGNNNQQSHHGGLDFDLQSPNNKSAYGYSVSVSSMDVSVVPDSSATSEISISHPRPPKGTIDLFSGPPVPMATQLTPLDREARVLRYREKKKNRKFEKTIRYASRKAYAETRPRIKGRFAKRTDVEVEVDQLFSTALMADTGYGIVPSF